MLLKVEDLEVSYGLIKAVKGVSFEVNEGEIVALIGANGAGKTTIMHALSGIIPKRGGKVVYKGKDITSLAPHKITAAGISQVPEGRRIFRELTVSENLSLGAYTRKDKKEIAETLEYVYDVFPVLKERKNQVAGTLSGGEQQMLAMSRALMAHPDLVLLDEPSMGLSPLYVNVVFDVIKSINKSGKTVFIVEQNAKKALSVADRAYVLETGNITVSGTGEQLLKDERVRSAYLGE
ncbi:MAG: ABC transporter ATP-binding protein [Clostridia bacterium]|nr:ABC transporter ATP-binding protein [Clostridia bacterium]